MKSNTWIAATILLLYYSLICSFETRIVIHQAKIKKNEKITRWNWEKSLHYTWFHLNIKYASECTSETQTLQIYSIFVTTDFVTFCFFVIFVVVVVVVVVAILLVLTKSWLFGIYFPCQTIHKKRIEKQNKKRVLSTQQHINSKRRKTFHTIHKIQCC